MTIEHAPSTNGHVTAGERPDEMPRARIATHRRRHPRVRPRRLLLPVALALGMVLLLRHFEQSTGDR